MRISIPNLLNVILVVIIIILSTLKSCQSSSFNKKISKLENQLRGCKDNIVLVPDREEVSKIPYNDSAKSYIPRPIIVSKDPDVYLIDSIIETTIYKYKNVDTAAILKDYFATIFYKDTIKGDYGNIIINDSVAENRIKSRTPLWNLSIPQKTTYIYKHKAGLYAGLDLYSDSKFTPYGIGGSLMYSSPKALNYEIGSYFTNEKSPQFQRSIMFRASIKFPLTKK